MPVLIRSYKRAVAVLISVRKEKKKTGQVSTGREKQPFLLGRAGIQAQPSSRYCPKAR